jgi:hypothetical protein
VAQLASTALALALLMLFGAFTAAAVGSEWLLMTGGERVNSLMFIALTAVLLIDRLLGSANEQQALRRSAPVIVWLAVFVSVLVLWRALTIEETRVIQHSTSLVASDARSQVSRDLEGRIEMLQRLSERAAQFQYDAELWARDAGALLHDINEFQSLSWSTPDLIVRYVAPRSNESKILGYNMLSDPVRGAVVQLAIQTKSVTLTPFTDLVVGGRVHLRPVFDGDTLLGIGAGALGKRQLGALAGRRPLCDHHIERGARARSCSRSKPILRARMVPGRKSSPSSSATSTGNCASHRRSTRCGVPHRVCRKSSSRWESCWLRFWLCSPIFSRPPGVARAT